MRFRPHCFASVLLCVRTLAAVAVMSAGGDAAPPTKAAQTKNQLPGDDIFSSTNLLRISIEIPEDGMQSLRNSQSGFQRQRLPQERPQARAKVIEGGRVYTNVAIQVKGTSSFQPIDAKPALTLNFDKLVPNQKFHGLSKISLNNSAQDPTFLHERFSRELFAAAGVPVPRADYAIVTLNGGDLGLYVLVEGFTREFLQRHFKRPDGNLYEAGVLQDIDRPLDVSPGKDPANHTAVQRLIAAAREPDPEKRLRELDAALDMDRFVSMVALETILCHSDSYSMNRNNYRMYHDTETDKIVFMPHGMDRVLGTHRTTLDLSIVPPLARGGMVAQALLSTSEGRRRHLERLAVLLKTLFDPERLGRRVREIDSKIIGEAMSQLSSRKARGTPVDQRLEDFEQATHRLVARRDQHVEYLCRRIATRAAIVKAQLEERHGLDSK